MLKREIIKLSQTREKLAELETLKARYRELIESYQARLARFDFVIRGHAVTDAYHYADLCPICNQELPENLHEELASPDKNERESLVLRLNGLTQTILQISDEEKQLRSSEEKLVSDIRRIRATLNDDLQPMLDTLISRASDYRYLLELRIEKEQLQVREEEVNSEIEKRLNLNFSEQSIDINERFPETFWKFMGTSLENFLHVCGVPNSYGVRFSKNDFDAIINGKLKRKEGKGYRALINTLVLLALREYFNSKEVKYNPSILMIDTPLLGFDDPQMDEEMQQIRDIVPKSLYELLINRQENGQMIIVDNTKFMPDISQLEEKYNLIRFTKNPAEGRYGFLEDFTDENIPDSSVEL